MFKKMTNEKLDRFIKNLIIVFLLLVSITIFYFLFSKHLKVIYEAFLLIFTPLLIALILAYLLEPLVSLLHGKCKINKKVVIGLIVFLAFLILAGFIYLLVRFVLEQMLAFFENDAIIILERIKEYMEQNRYLNYLLQKILEYDFGSHFDNPLNYLRGLFSTVSNMLINLILVPIFLVVLLLDKRKFFSSIVNIFSKRISTHLLNIGIRSNEVIKVYFRGKIISMLFIWVFLSIGFSLIGLSSYSLFFAIILTILDLVPYIGPFIGVIIPVLYSFIFRDSISPFYEWTPVFVLAINLVGQTLQNYVVLPSIVGKKMNISPILILVSMLFFGRILGIWGVILSIPLCGCIKVVYNYVFKERSKEG